MKINTVISTAIQQIKEGVDDFNQKHLGICASYPQDVTFEITTGKTLFEKSTSKVIVTVPISKNTKGFRPLK